MCVMCENGLSVSETLSLMQQRVKEHGWIVTGVEEPDEALAYTVGLTERGWPELVVTGGEWKEMAALINATVDGFTIADTQPREGFAYSVKLHDGSVRVRLRRFDNADRLLPVVRQLYSGRRWEAVRVVVI